MTVSSEFSGKVAMVTGAARGIGRASARAFADRGCAVIVCDVLDEGQETVEQIQRADGKARFARCDVSDPASVRAAVGVAVKEFGRLDFAHNNAGTFHPTLLADLDVQDWQRVLDVNLTGVFLCMKYQIQQMLGQTGEQRGAIVNTASIWSYNGAGAQAAYAASKAGVLGLTRTAAIDYGLSGIRVNAVAPGPIETAMTASVPPDLIGQIIGRTTLRRYGQPAEIGQAVVWLCSEQASYVNGATLPVDGGWLVT